MKPKEWKFFESTLAAAPPAFNEMYERRNEQFTFDEHLSMIQCLRQIHEGMEEEPTDSENTLSTILSMMYGRLIGLAKKLQETQDSQTRLEAELAFAIELPAEEKEEK